MWRTRERKVITKDVAFLAVIAHSITEMEFTWFQRRLSIHTIHIHTSTTLVYVHVLVLHCTAQASSQSLHQATRMVGTMPAVRVLATSFITAANPPSSFVWRRRASQAIAGVCFVIATLLITL